MTILGLLRGHNFGKQLVKLLSGSGSVAIDAMSMRGPLPEVI